ERRYPWMDEGFNTFIDYGSAEGYFKGTAYGDTVRRDLLSAARISAVPGNEQPLIDKPVEQHDLAWAAYQKPALMLMVLRDAVLGKEPFERAMREYVRRWTFRHPQPADFFRRIENVSGRGLDWFWREWVVSLESQGAWIDAPGLGGPPPLEEPPSDPTDARIAAIAAPPAPRATAVFHAESRFCLSSPIWLRGMVTSEPALKYSVAVSERKRRPATTSESGSA